MEKEKMTTMWDKRYSNTEFVYGKEPNKFLKASLEKYKVQGNILFPAEGEGRNAVYAAKQGIHVDAFDISHEGQKKALTFAKSEGVTIEYQLGMLSDLNYAAESFDAIALIYAHFPPPMREGIHTKLIQLLKPGGLVILEGFSVGNLIYRAKNPGIGGPDKAPLLFTTAMIQNDFKNIDVLQLEALEVELNEGDFHKGTGEVIRFIGQKK